MGDELAVRVEYAATRRGENTPKRIFIGERTIDVIDVIDRWFGHDHAYYKVRDTDQVTYILRQGAFGRWQLVMLDRLPDRP